MIKIRAGAEVMAPHPRTGILKSAVVLVAMPTLAIIEFYEDRTRLCLPRVALRVLGPPINAT